MPVQDRRQKRSQDPLVALHYQLAQARSAGALDAIVVADTAGLVVAGAGSWAACEELAAYAPLLASISHGEAPPAATQAEASRVEVVRRDTAVSRLEVDDQEVLVCVRGGLAAADRTTMLAAATSGVARILRAAA